MRLVDVRSSRGERTLLLLLLGRRRHGATLQQARLPRDDELGELD